MACALEGRDVVSDRSGNQRRGDWSHAGDRGQAPCRVVLPRVRDNHRFECLDLVRGRATVLEQLREHLPSLLGKGRIFLHERFQVLKPMDALRGDHPELSSQPARSIRQHRLLLDQQRSSGMHSQSSLLFKALGRHELRLRPGGGGAERRCIGSVVLLASLDEWFDRLRRNQLYLVPEAAQHTSPVMRRTARLQNDSAGLLPLEERDQLTPLQLALQVRLAACVHAVDLEYGLCRIETDHGNAHRGRLLCCRLSRPALWHTDAVGGRPPHLIGNSAYRRYLRRVASADGKGGKAKPGPAFEIDVGKLAEEARYDGIFVLRTNARITPLQAMLRYRELLAVETLFRKTKGILRTRPIYHSSDAAIRGHVFCSFLALVLQKELDSLCRAKGVVVEWADLIRDLDRLQEATIEKDGKRITTRTQVEGQVGLVFQATGVALPPHQRELAT
jgi:hypothetical protein